MGGQLDACCRCILVYLFCDNGRCRASTVKRELEQEAEKASKAATAAAKDAETARARIDGELQAAKKILDSFAQVTGTASEIERLGRRGRSPSPIALISRIV